MEPTVSSKQENILQKPDIAQQSDMNNEKLNEFHVGREKMNLNSEETTNIDRIDREYEPQEYVPKTEMQLPQHNEQEKK